MLTHLKKSLIYLTGFMGSGKSTVGNELARSLCLQFSDLDLLIEQKMGKSIAEIFRDEGHIFFRTLENGILKEIARNSNAVVALGGGTLLEDENLAIVKESGLMIWLSAEPPELWKRISSLDKRNLLGIREAEGMLLSKEEDLYKKIQLLVDIRKPSYEEAGFFIDTTLKTIEQIVSEIIFELEKGNWL